MSKYKVGDEILIKAKITDVEPQDPYPYVVMTPTGQKPWLKEDDITGLTEDEYNRGLEDAWELAKKVCLTPLNGGMSGETVCKIYGTDCYGTIMNMAPQEALAKLEAYEKEQAEKIKVGDVVEVFGLRGVVVYANNGVHNVVHASGSLSVRLTKEQITKTGKHINITEILAEIGKE